MSKINQQRRHWLALGVGAAAAAGGAGLAWWRFQPHDMEPRAEDQLWSRSFVTPGGEALPMASLRGKALLVNFWATWCPPCVRELPMLDEFAASQGDGGIQVLGLAVDKAEAVSRFLTRTPLRFPIALAQDGGLALTRALGNLQGGLPFTLLLDSGGNVQQRKIGELSAKDLELWSQKA